MHVAQLCVLRSDRSLELLNSQLELGCEFGRAGVRGSAAVSQLVEQTDQPSRCEHTGQVTAVAHSQIHCKNTLGKPTKFL